MLPLRLVIDTSALVAAALKPEGLQCTALVLSVTKPARFYVSHPILEEYAAVLSRPQLDIRKGVRLQLLQLHRRSKPARCGTCGTCLGFDGIAQSRCPRASARTTNDWP